ncbi:MAG: MarR family transcriptional regulator [Sphingobacteriia bacterium]|nr:MarR family transcriptional regulator [Sphingobacteriia bacterium]
MNYNEVIIDIRKIIRALNLESKRIQKIYGVSIPQILCLIFINECIEKKATHKSIADFLKLNKSTVTGIVDRLVTKGLVVRLPDLIDRRISMVTLTPQGLDLINNSPNLLHQQLATNLQKMPEHTIENVSLALKEIIFALGIEEPNDSPVMTIEVSHNSNH